MSTLFYRSLLLFLAAVSTANAQLLLEKVELPGFVMTNYASKTRCSISDTGVLSIQHQLGDLTSKRSHPLQLTIAKTKTAINSAAVGKITSSSMAVDGPTIIFRAYQMQADGTAKLILLYEENGMTGIKKVNNSDAAVLLRNFIDLNCGGSLLLPPAG